MITTWVLLITLVMPTFGGPVLARVEFTDRASCYKMRTLILKHLGITTEADNLTPDKTRAIVSLCEEWRRG